MCTVYNNELYKMWKHNFGNKQWKRDKVKSKSRLNSYIKITLK